VAVRYPLAVADAEQVEAAYDVLTRLGNETAEPGGQWDDLLDRAHHALGLVLVMHTAGGGRLVSHPTRWRTQAQLGAYRDAMRAAAAEGEAGEVADPGLPVARCVEPSCGRVGQFAAFGGQAICPPGHAGDPIDLDADAAAAGAALAAERDGTAGP
jgi:hypothetical protein